MVCLVSSSSSGSFGDREGVSIALKDDHQDPDWQRDLLPLLRNKKVSMAGDSMVRQLVIYMKKSLSARNVDRHEEEACDGHKACGVIQDMTEIKGVPLISFHEINHNVTFQYWSTYPRNKKEKKTFKAIKNIGKMFQSSDVVILQYGFHWLKQHEANYRAHIAIAVKGIRHYIDEDSSKIGLIKETLPQHFNTTDGSGDWEHRQNRTQCIPLSPTTGYEPPGQWRNYIVNEVANREKMQHIVIPQWELMRNYTRHAVPGTDCTHYAADDKYAFERILSAYVPFL